jgi:hypothetical protein
MTDVFKNALRNFPIAWKRALISPIPKIGGGHRPIALLSQMGKILERAVNWKAEQTLQVATDQFGCRNSVAVDLVIYKFYNFSILEDGEFGLAVFVDLKKAFDRVIRSQVLEKLIDDAAPPWLIFFFNDFFSQRSQDLLRCLQISSRPLGSNHHVSATNP